MQSAILGEFPFPSMPGHKKFFSPKMRQDQLGASSGGIRYRKYPKARAVIQAAMRSHRSLVMASPSWRGVSALALWCVFAGVSAGMAGCRSRRQAEVPGAQRIWAGRKFRNVGSPGISCPKEFDELIGHLIPRRTRRRTRCRSPPSRRTRRPHSLRTRRQRLFFAARRDSLRSAPSKSRSAEFRRTRRRTRTPHSLPPISPFTPPS